MEPAFLGEMADSKDKLEPVFLKLCWKDTTGVNWGSSQWSKLEQFEWQNQIALNYNPKYEASPYR